MEAHVLLLRVLRSPSIKAVRSDGGSAFAGFGVRGGLAPGPKLLCIHAPDHLVNVGCSQVRVPLCHLGSLVAQHLTDS